MISVIIPVYHNESTLQKNLEYLEKVERISEKIIVFDGYHPPAPFGCNTYDLYRGMKTIANYPDVKWGNARARNIGAINARNEWLLFLDVDHTLKSQIKGSDFQRLNKLQVMRMKRTYKGNTVWPSGSIIIHRELFFSVGGYDERFCGNYGYEDLHLIHKVGKSTNTEIELSVLPEGRVNLKRDTTVNMMLFEKLKHEISG
jgi:predicted glycosyltransferase involved in capsule biosynthesis